MNMFIRGAARPVLSGMAVALTLIAGSGAAVAQPDHDRSRTRVFELDPSTPGNGPEGIAFDKDRGAFYVSAFGDGTIYRGTLHGSVLTPFLPGGTDGRTTAYGLTVSRGLLYVAGGPTGSFWVYDLATGTLKARFDTGPGGFINDLVVTRPGDVFVTDSFRPILWHVTTAQVNRGGGRADAIPVDPEIPYASGPFAFNLNGIVANQRGDVLWSVQSTGPLWRIRFPDLANLDNREISEVHVDGGPFGAGDGMAIDPDTGQLLIVQNGLDGGQAQIDFVTLQSGGTTGVVTDRLTDATFETPTTVAVAHDRYLVVNSHIAVVNGQIVVQNPPWTVSGVPRRQGGRRHE